jgi:hypothetical protein
MEARDLAKDVFPLCQLPVKERVAEDYAGPVGRRRRTQGRREHRVDQKNVRRKVVDPACDLGRDRWRCQRAGDLRHRAARRKFVDLGIGGRKRLGPQTFVFDPLHCFGTAEKDHLVPPVAQGMCDA